MTCSRVALFALLLVSSGCEAIAAGTADEEPEPEQEVEPPADELEARLRERGREVAPYMILDGPALRGETDEGGVRDFSHILHPGWCYKVVGLGDDGVEDLDIRVYDPNDVLLQRDTTRDPQPYLGQMRPICPPESGTYRIQVRMVAGSGPFAAQVYRSI